VLFEKRFDRKLRQFDADDFVTLFDQPGEVSRLAAQWYEDAPASGTPVFLQARIAVILVPAGSAFLPALDPKFRQGSDFLIARYG
jgi:hypothetical protein